MAKKDDRSRSWVFISYPDSMPENWRELIVDTHIELCISPLHNKDINPTGEEKKPHYHIILHFGSNKSYDQVIKITELINGTIPQKVSNMKGYVRYLVHKDNPEKAQYNETDIECFNGFDISSYLKASGLDRYALISEMCSWIDENGICEFSDFVDYCIKSRFDWFQIICDSGCMIIKEYLKSKRFQSK